MPGALQIKAGLGCIVLWTWGLHSLPGVQELCSSWEARSLAQISFQKSQSKQGHGLNAVTLQEHTHCG